MKLVWVIDEVWEGEELEEIWGGDLYGNMNVEGWKCKVKIKGREKIGVWYVILVMREKVWKEEREKWKERIVKVVDIEER